ncbi:MAG: hypothetical protein ABSF15_12805 [Candidatus Sulfotelmatobacter sp.]
MAAAIIFAAPPMAVSSWGESKPVQVEDPFPAIDCTAYDTGKYVTDKHAEACRSFVQLAKAKDPMLPLHVGPVYACFGINDELLVLDTAMDQAKSENKKWAALAEPSVAFYQSGIENGMSVAASLWLEGEWDLSQAPSAPSYTGHFNFKSEDNKQQAAIMKTHVPHATMFISETSISFWDWTIQTSTGRFRYWTPDDDPSFRNKSIQLTGQCAVFKRDVKIESSPKATIQHGFWKQIN